MVSETTTSAGMPDARMILIIIISVLAFSAFIGWMAWLSLKSAFKTLENPKRMKRLLTLGAMIYLFGAVNGIVKVATGSAPLLSLIGLPIPLLFIWFFLRAASRVKVPPK
jgi:flagellar basal body-associated protein FliL